MLIKHEELLEDTECNTLKLFDFCNLKPSQQLYDYIKVCHTKDTEQHVHNHDTIVTKDTVLNRWKQQYKNKEIIDYANCLTGKYWQEFYRPLY